MRQMRPFRDAGDPLMMGIPVRTDSTVPPDELHVEQDGKVIAKIVNIGPDAAAPIEQRETAPPSPSPGSPEDATDAKQCLFCGASQVDVVLHLQDGEWQCINVTMCRLRCASALIEARAALSLSRERAARAEQERDAQRIEASNANFMRLDVLQRTGERYRKLDAALGSHGPSFDSLIDRAVEAIAEVVSLQRQVATLTAERDEAHKENEVLVRLKEEADGREDAIRTELEASTSRLAQLEAEREALTHAVEALPTLATISDDELGSTPAEAVSREAVKSLLQQHLPLFQRPTP